MLNGEGSGGGGGPSMNGMGLCNLRWADPYVQIENREHASYQLTHINEGKEGITYDTIRGAARALNLSP